MLYRNIAIQSPCVHLPALISSRVGKIPKTKLVGHVKLLDWHPWHHEITRTVLFHCTMVLAWTAS